MSPVPFSLLLVWPALPAWRVNKMASLLFFTQAPTCVFITKSNIFLLRPHRPHLQSVIVQKPRSFSVQYDEYPTAIASWSHTISLLQRGLHCLGVSGARFFCCDLFGSHWFPMLGNSPMLGHCSPKQNHWASTCWNHSLLTFVKSGSSAWISGAVWLTLGSPIEEQALDNWFFLSRGLLIQVGPLPLQPDLHTT